MRRLLAAAIAVLVVAAAGLVAVGLAFGNAGLLLPRVPPRSGMDRFLVIVFPAACLLEVGLAALRPQVSSAVHMGLGVSARLVAGTLFGWVLLWGSVYLRGEPDWLLLGAWAVTSAVLWQVMPRQRAQGVIAAALSLAILATGVLIVLGGWLKGGLATLPFAVATAGLSWRANDHGFRSIVIGSGTAALVGLLSLGHFFGRVSLVQAGFLVVLLASSGTYAAAQSTRCNHGLRQSAL